MRDFDSKMLDAINGAIAALVHVGVPFLYYQASGNAFRSAAVLLLVMLMWYTSGKSAYWNGYRDAELESNPADGDSNRK